MAKGKRQSAEELVQRYAQETVPLAAAAQDAPPATTAPTDPVLAGLRRNLNRVVMLPLHLLHIEENVRRSVDQGAPEFLALVDSIREFGVRQNLIVDLQDEAPGEFRLVVIAGQRRTLAAQQAGCDQVAALILRLGTRGARLLEGLAENLLREDLHCLDQAEAYAALIAEGWTESALAEKFERRRRTVLQFLRLAKYPPAAKDLIRAHREVFTTYLLLNKFIAKSWKSEGELLQALQQCIPGQGAARPRPTPRQPRTAPRLIQSINRYNGLQGKVQGSEESGKIVIQYKNKAAFEKILSIFEQD